MNHHPLSPRQFTGLLMALSLLIVGTVLGYAPERGGDYSFHIWEASQPDQAHKVLSRDSLPTTCYDLNSNTVCAEFKSLLTDSVDGLCCILVEDLGSNDPNDCLIGVTYTRERVPEE